MNMIQFKITTIDLICRKQFLEYISKIVRAAFNR